MESNGMNIDLKTLPNKVLPILHVLKRYMVLIFILALVSIYGFLVFNINAMAQKEPTEDAVQEKLNTVQRPKIDKQSLDKIQQLEDQNIDVQVLFKQARDNPFSE
jgi:hypothetical protein